MKHIDNRVDGLTQDYKGLVESNQGIINKLLEDKLYKEPPRAQQMQGAEPIRMKRPNWNKIRTDYEIQQKKKFWESRIKEVEERDKQGSVGAGSQTPSSTDNKE